MQWLLLARIMQLLTMSACLASLITFGFMRIYPSVVSLSPVSTVFLLASMGLVLALAEASFAKLLSVLATM